MSEKTDYLEKMANSHESEAKRIREIIKERAVLERNGPPLTEDEVDMQDRIQRVLISLIDHSDLPYDWPGTLPIANAIIRFGVRNRT